MKRAKDYIIFPLDVPTIKAAKTYVELLSESVGMFKGWNFLFDPDRS